MTRGLLFLAIILSVGVFGYSSGEPAGTVLSSEDLEPSPSVSTSDNDRTVMTVAEEAAELEEMRSPRRFAFSSSELFLLLAGAVLVSLNPILAAGWGILSYIIFSLLGMFIKKPLNPLYEQQIEPRVNHVTLWIITYYAAMIGFPLVFLLVLARLFGIDDRDTLAILAMFVAAACSVLFWICGYRVSCLKGYPGKWAVFWGFMSLTLVGFPILWGCVSYRHTGDPLDIPVYRGRKIRFRCTSCAQTLLDYECSIGSEGICPKCQSSQAIV